MNDASRQRKQSARFYGFEETIWELPGFAHLRERRPIAELQLLAGLVWARERGSGTCPKVESRAVSDTSYFVPATNTIQLVRKHQNAGGLLHEISHALGKWDKRDHGPAFRKRCIRLYETYGDWNGEVKWP